MRQIKDNRKNAPIFILGVQRSGTTLLRLLLDSHSQIAIPFESFVIIDFYKKFEKYNELRSPTDRERLVKDLLQSKGIRDWHPSISANDICIEQCTTYAEILNEIFSTYAIKQGKKIWGDKSPSYTKDFHILNQLFPNAKFINMIRDGRDVALSIDRNDTVGPVGFMNALRYWAEIVKWSRKMGAMLPAHRYLEVKYEELVNYPQLVLKNLFDFIDLPFEERVIHKFNENLTAKLPTHSLHIHQSLRFPVSSKFAFKWKIDLGLADQALAYRLVGDLIDELGYPAGKAEVNNFVLLWRRFIHWLRSWFRWHFIYEKRLFN